MSLDDIEKRLYNMEEEPFEEEEDLDYSSFNSQIDSEPKQEVTQYYRKEESKKRPPPIDFYEKKKKKSNIWLYVVTFILFLGLIGEGFFLAQKVSSQKTGIQIDINTVDNIFLGEPFNVEISYKNNSANLLQNAVLTLTLPENIKIIGSEDENINVFKKDLGNIGTGVSNIEKFNLIAMGSPNRVDTIKATLQYNIIGFDSRFEKIKEQTIAIGGPMVDFNLAVPQKIVSGKEFSFKVNFINNSNAPLSNLKIQLYYPLGFNFSGADINPTDGNNVWIWKTLQPNERGEINIRGTIIGEKNSYYEIGVNINIIAANKTVSLEKKTAMVNILETPLDIAIYVNNSKDYVAKVDESLDYRIEYQNNTDMALNDVIIKAELEGQMFNLTDISTDGYFDSLKNQIIWNGGNVKNLKLLNKGDKGSVNFKVTTATNYPTRSLNDKNQTLKVKVTIDSPTVPQNSSVTSTTAVAESIVKVADQVNLESYALFRDAASGIVNKGSLPLKVGKTTNFTIHWKIINYNNDLENVTVKTILPQGVSYTGAIAGNYGDDAPQFNQRTGEIVWNIKNVDAFTGILSPAKELIFQIAVTPSSNQVGIAINLIGDTTLTATDKFTGQKMEAKYKAISSNLTSDPTVTKDEGIVNP